VLFNISIDNEDHVLLNPPFIFAMDLRKIYYKSLNSVGLRIEVLLLIWAWGKICCAVPQDYQQIMYAYVPVHSDDFLCIWYWEFCGDPLWLAGTSLNPLSLKEWIHDHGLTYASW